MKDVEERKQELHHDEDKITYKDFRNVFVHLISLLFFTFQCKVE